MSNKMFGNSMITAVETAVMMIMVIIATPTLLRNFGVASYGAFVFLNIFSFYGALFFFDLGMEASLTTYIARYDAEADKKKMQQSLVVASLYYGVLGVLLGLGLLVASEFIANRFIEVKAELDRETVRVALNIISVNVLLQFLVLPFVAVLQGLRKYTITKSVNSVSTVIQYTLIMIVSHYHSTIDKAFLVMACISLARLLFYVGLFRFGFPQFRQMSLRADFSQLKVLIGYSSVLFVCRILGLINNNIHKLAIWLYLPVTCLATYDVVMRPSNLARVTDTVVGTSTIPEVARLSALRREGEIAALYVRLIRYTYLMMIPLVAFLAVFIADLLQVWVGDQFVPYAYLVHILLVAFLLAPVSTEAFLAVVGLERISDAIWISITGTVLNAVLCLTLSYHIGLAGFPLAALAMYSFMFWPFLKKLEQYVGLRPRTVLSEIGRTLAFAMPFAAIYLLVELLLREYTAVMLGVAMVVGAGHLLAEYKWLLVDQERAFVKDLIEPRARRWFSFASHNPADRQNRLGHR